MLSLKLRLTLSLSGECDSELSAIVPLLFEELLEGFLLPIQIRRRLG